jgi:hypothetical protein
LVTQGSERCIDEPVGLANVLQGVEQLLEPRTGQDSGDGRLPEQDLHERLTASARLPHGRRDQLVGGRATQGRREGAGDGG